MTAVTAPPAARGAEEPPEIVRAKVAEFAGGERVEFRIVADHADKVLLRYRGERYRLSNDASICGDFTPGEPRPPCDRFLGSCPARGRCYRFAVIAKNHSGRDERRFERCLRTG